MSFSDSRFVFAVRLTLSCLLLAFFLPVLPASAATTCTVTDAGDNPTAPDPNSLRGKLADTTCDRIIFAPALANQTITLVNNPPGNNHLTINRNVEIDGEATGIKISGGDTVRIFNISSTSAITVKLANLTLQNGKVTAGGGLSSSGGAIIIASNATVTIAQTNILNSSARVGGGIYNFGGTLTIQRSTISGNTTIQAGAGIFNGAGTLTLQQSTISGNTAAAIGGGGIHNAATLTIEQSTISGNTATGGAGGGILNTTNLTLVSSIVAANTKAATATGADIAHTGTSVTSQGNNLIGSNETLPPLQSTDQAGTAGAPLDARLGPLQNNGGPTFTMLPQAGSPAINKGPATSTFTTDQRGTGFPRALGIVDIGAVEFNPCEVQNTADNGVGSLRDRLADASCPRITFNASLANQTITLLNNLVVSHNVEIDGEATGIKISGGDTVRIFTIPNSPSITAVKLIRLTLQNGKVAGLGLGGSGGAILNSANSATITIAQTSILNSSARVGGGLYTFGGTIIIQQSTISGNTAQVGGGINGGGIMTIEQSTISGNTATAGPGGGISTGGTLTLKSSIVAGNTKAATATGADISQTAGSTTSQGNNLIGSNETVETVFPATTLQIADTTVGEGGAAAFNVTLTPNAKADVAGTATAVLDPKLGTLANNGGPTLTLLPQAGSPAINNGPTTSTFTTDQRGLPRLVGPKVDIGAVETSDTTAATTTVAYATSDGTASAGSDYTATNGTLTFTAGEVQKTISVPTTQDNMYEADETFTVTLSNPGGAVLGTPASASGTITNDDAMPTVSIADSSASEGSPVVFTVSLSDASGVVTTVDYTTSNGSAVAPGNYTTTTGTLTFAPGETQKTISVPTIAIDTTGKTFTVILSNPTNATLGTSKTATGTITKGQHNVYLPLVIK